MRFQETEHLCCDDDVTSVNKARNYQKLSSETGKKICDLIEAKHKQLLGEQEIKRQRDRERLPPPFFEFNPNTVHDHDALWSELLAQVEAKLGMVILACPFGSQRYNCQTENSDVDMFVVYQAPTSKFLGFALPPMTIKARSVIFLEVK